MAPTKEIGLFENWMSYAEARKTLKMAGIVIPRFMKAATFDDTYKVTHRVFQFGDHARSGVPIYLRSDIARIIEEYGTRKSEEFESKLDKAVADLQEAYASWKTNRPRV